MTSETVSVVGFGAMKTPGNELDASAAFSNRTEQHFKPMFVYNARKLSNEIFHNIQGNA